MDNEDVKIIAYSGTCLLNGITRIREDYKFRDKTFNDQGLIMFEEGLLKALNALDELITYIDILAEDKQTLICTELYTSVAMLHDVIQKNLLNVEYEVNCNVIPHICKSILNLVGILFKEKDCPISDSLTREIKYLEDSLQDTINRMPSKTFFTLYRMVRVAAKQTEGHAQEVANWLHKYFPAPKA